MNTPATWIAVSIVVIAVAALLVLFVGKDQRASRLTPWAGLSFGLIMAGLVFGDDRLLGYSLLGAGVIVAVVDMVNRSRKK